MKKIAALSIVFFLCIHVFGATPQDEIQTYYENGRFITKCKVWIDASEPVTTSVMDDFMIQFRSDLDKLFTWGLKDMRLQGEGDDLIVYNLKSSTYDPETGIIHGKMDAIVPGFITVPDIAVDGKMYKKQVSNKQIVVQYDILRATGFIKEANATFSIIRENQHSAWCTLEFQVKFGWFFNIFITQKRYKQNLEWRFEQLIKNLRDESQRREKALKHTT